MGILLRQGYGELRNDDHDLDLRDRGIFLTHFPDARRPEVRKMAAEQ
jgi:hypothetical protein